jgi:hypothetical protein
MTPLNPYALIGSVNGEPIAQHWWLLVFWNGPPLGYTFVQAPAATLAVSAAWALDVNPGGDVTIIDVPPDLVDRIPADHRNRLLSDDEFRVLAETRTIDPLIGAIIESETGADSP